MNILKRITEFKLNNSRLIRSVSILITLFICNNLSLVYANNVNFEKDTSVPLVYINIALKTGAAHDPKNQTGITNFTGEMLLRGTQKKTKEQIDLALDQMGAVLEVETRLEAVIFRGAVLSSQLQSFLELFNEILTTPSFPEKEFIKLKKEIISGLLEQQGKDSTLGSKMYTEFLFSGHPYGTPLMGNIPDLEKLELSAVKDSYLRMMSQPENIYFLGTGDAEVETINQWSNSILSQLKSLNISDKHRQKSIQAPVQRSKLELLIVDKPDRTQTQIFGGQIGVTLTHSDYFPLYLANYSFGGGSFSSRLMVEIRVKKGWSYGASSNFRHGLQPRSWSFHLFPAEKDTPEAVAKTIELVSDFKEKGISESEFNFAKQSLVNSAGFNYNTPSKRVENLILEKTLNLPSGFMKSYAKNISNLKLDEVNLAVNKFIKPEQLAITVLGTASNIKKPLMEKLKLSEDQVKVIDYRKNLKF